MVTSELTNIQASIALVLSALSGDPVQNGGPLPTDIEARLRAEGEEQQLVALNSCRRDLASLHQRASAAVGSNNKSQAVVVDDERQIEMLLDGPVDALQEADELFRPVSRQALAEQEAGLNVSAVKSVVVQRRLESCVMVAARPRFRGSPGCVRSSAWIWLFSSTQSTKALSGGLNSRPTNRSTFPRTAGRSKP